jgi:hypothetical protein
VKLLLLIDVLVEMSVVALALAVALRLIRRWSMSLFLEMSLVAPGLHLVFISALVLKYSIVLSSLTRRLLRKNTSSVIIIHQSSRQTPSRR